MADEAQRFPLAEIAPAPEAWLAELNRRQHVVAQQVLTHNRRLLRSLDGATRDHVEAMAHLLAERLLSRPAAAIAECEDARRRDEAIALLCELFGDQRGDGAYGDTAAG